jgi:hypothetical protein
MSFFLFHSFRFCNCSCRVELLPSCLGFHAISPTEISACLFHERHKNPFFFSSYVSFTIRFSNGFSFFLFLFSSLLKRKKKIII